MEDKKKRRPRRTNSALEKDIMRAAKMIIEEEGFANTTLTAIAQQANIEPNVFYKRFLNLDNLFDKFVQTYDYGINDIMNMQSENNNYQEYYSDLLIQLANSLYQDKSMQQILVWDVSEDNTTTRNAAVSRESASKLLVDRYKEIFKDTNFNLDVFSALLIGGIYYLIIRQKRSPFCGVDFSSSEGKEKLIESIKNISTRIFVSIEEDSKIAKIIYNMRKEGLDNQLISKFTGLTLEELEDID